MWWTDPAFADRRVALVIGNSAYQHVPALATPAKDARAMAAMFQKAGYDVVNAFYDAGDLEMKRAVRQFEEASANADVAVVYYAGHGIEIHGINYLVPVDAKLASDRDADDEAITLDRLVGSIDGVKRLRLIILDACRDDPFAQTMKQQRTAIAGPSASQPTSTNTLIAYAAKGGSVATDGPGDHSPFTTALLDNIFTPGLDIRLAFGRVRDEVLKKTANQQEPFVYGSLGGGNISLVPEPTTALPTQFTDAGAQSDYYLVKKIGTKLAWQVFLLQYPTGFYHDLGQDQLSRLNAAEQNSSTAPSSNNVDNQPIF
jgi:uncharacterized caspase-like protein